ncbi:prolyl oligopeptidase-like protein [Mollisia scopiformis]|uniref:Carboxylic ester hydrolase n=1 Tax=Mollisia scopiformis TaxID=149040 RepID=A0A194WTQ2_MOLSC|nr:prolyl oligopeptidase-like protein [Mollisia scopiformis]KUJ10987.1 prolyl oligopeptidase-like protein [Mollisia scopiformis]
MHFQLIPSCFAIASLCGAAIASSQLPTVDLGYAIYQATINPPVGALRFAPPLPPVGRNATINTGQTGVIPAQANPAWEVIAELFLDAYLTGQNISEFTNETSALALLSNLTAPAPDPSVSEDCLFLDVIVPEKIFNGSSSVGKTVKAGAPVLVWIYGGGYTEGSKLSAGDPASLVARSQLDGSEGVIFVAMNYRLGLFGWLSGNSEVTDNVGLLDQRLALEWVQSNIHLFGGDPSRVTVMGESAGGGSIMHHSTSDSALVTSYGGKGPAPPFQQAIPQSPAFQIMVPEQSKAIFSQVLGNASIVAGKTISCAEDLRALPFEVLAAVNTLMVGNSMYGTFTFGPVVDPSPNSYVPDLPLRLVAEDKFHNVSLMVGHNSDEGLLFTPPFVQTQAEFVDEFATLFPTANASTISYLTETLYPPVYDGTYGYTDAIGRTSLAISDFLVGCNAHYLASMLSPSYAYLFAVPPALHGEDVPYTFFNGDTSTSDDGLPVSSEVATAFQRYLTTFAMTGTPVSEGFQTFSRYGQNDTVTEINLVDFGSHIKDPAARSVCQFWATAPYYVAGSS